MLFTFMLFLTILYFTIGSVLAGFIFVFDPPKDVGEPQAFMCCLFAWPLVMFYVITVAVTLILKKVLGKC